MPDVIAPAPSITPHQFRRAWTLISISGMFGIFYFTVEYLSAARVGFLSELHATPFDFGLIAAIYAMAFGFQLVSGALINHLRRRKPWFVMLAITHRLLFLAIPLAPFFIPGERSRIWFIVAVLMMHDTLQQLATPIYFSWMADLVPTGAMNRYWGSRQRWITLSTILSNLALGIGLYHYEVNHRVATGFLIFGVLAALGGVTDILLFLFVPEPANHRTRPSSLRRVIAQPLRDPDFRHFLQFMIYWFAVTMMAAPFFFVYMKQCFGLTIMAMQLMLVAEAVGGMVSARFWGLICDTYGQENGIQLSLVAKAIIPLTLILVPPVKAIAAPLLIVAFFIDGLMNAGFLIAWQGLLMKSTPRNNRSMYIGATNFLCQGLAGGIAPFLSGALIGPLNRHLHLKTGYIHWNGFLVIFAISLVFRLLAWPVAWRMQSAAQIPFRRMLKHLLSSNPLAVTRAVYQLHGAARPATRVRAARRLGRMGSPLAIGGLIDALQDPALAVREAAAEALGQIGMAEAHAPLSRALGDPTLGIQLPAARALGQIGGLPSLKALLTHLDRLDHEALSQAIDSLARIDHQAAILPLICLFERTEKPELRARIAAALGRLSRAGSSADVMMVMR